jgi:hypothetical protein
MCVYCLVLVQANIYEEEDTCHMRRRIHVCVLPGVGTGEPAEPSLLPSPLPMSYEEEDTCHMRGRIHVI